MQAHVASFALHLVAYDQESPVPCISDNSEANLPSHSQHILSAQTYECVTLCVSVKTSTVHCHHLMHREKTLNLCGTPDMPSTPSNVPAFSLFIYLFIYCKQ